LDQALTARAKLPPISARFVEHTEGRVDIRPNEILGAVDGPIDVSFGCEVQDDLRPVLR
jgi:hypothetical protein